VLAGGKLHFTADTGRLYCVDPATRAACAAGSLPTGLDTSAGGEYDILARGTRVYVSRTADKVACLDVATGATCQGWVLPRSFGARWNLVDRFEADGAITGVCVVETGGGDCVPDAAPATSASFTGWPQDDAFYSATQEAETGTRTFTSGSLEHGVVGCWDWVTMARCTGGGYNDDGQLNQGPYATGLAHAYGTAWDGSCVVGLGDPGSVFTVDPAGFAPCAATASAAQEIDLRAQRCDGAVGGASWDAVALEDSPAGELASARVTIRDGSTGALLAAKDLTAGPLDL
jgi:hypothetical protein